MSPPRRCRSANAPSCSASRASCAMPAARCCSSATSSTRSSSSRIATRCFVMAARWAQGQLGDDRPRCSSSGSWSAGRSSSCFRSRKPASVSRTAARRGPGPRRRIRRHRRSRCAAARSSASTDWWARAAPSSRRCCSACDARRSRHLQRAARGHRAGARGSAEPGQHPAFLDRGEYRAAESRDAGAARLVCARAMKRSSRAHWIEALGIKAQGPAQPVQQPFRRQPAEGGASPSGWRASPGVLILDEPTKGIDVGAKAAVHAVTSEFARAGNGVIMISSELPEILGMSDRVLVMRRGRLRGEFTRAKPPAKTCCAQRATHERHRVAALDRRGAPRLQAGAADAWPVRRRDSRLPGFATPRNLAGVLDDTAILIMLALGQMLVILVRGIDLSMAANLALCGMLAALFNRAFPGAGVAAGAAAHADRRRLAGRLNGLLVWKLRLPPIVVTLGTMSDVSRRDLSTVARRVGQRERDVARLPRVSRARSSSGSRRSRGSRSRVAAAFIVALQRSTRGARPVRRGRQSRGGRVFRHRSRGACSSSPTPLRAPLPACAATCGWRASPWPIPTSRSASSCR